MLIPRDNAGSPRWAGVGASGAPLGGTRAYAGHAHFWQRAMSRRGFLARSAAATGAVATAGLWMPQVAQAAAPHGSNPVPIPGGIVVNGELFHVFPAAEGVEPSTIFNFDGVVGMAEVDGTGTGTDTKTGQTQALLFDVDMRFIQGTYIGEDGNTHHGTFGFV